MSIIDLYSAESWSISTALCVLSGNDEIGSFAAIVWSCCWWALGHRDCPEFQTVGTATEKARRLKVLTLSTTTATNVRIRELPSHSCGGHFTKSTSKACTAQRRRLHWTVQRQSWDVRVWTALSQPPYDSRYVLLRHVMWLMQEDLCLSRLGPSSCRCIIHIRLFVVDLSRRLQVCEESKRTTVSAAEPSKGRHYPSHVTVYYNKRSK